MLACLQRFCQHELIRRKDFKAGCPRGRRLSPPGVAGGALSDGGSVAIGLAAARPDEVVTFPVLVVEEAGVDWSVEARIVELDREIAEVSARWLTFEPARGRQDRPV